MNISLNKHAQTEVQVGTCQLCLMCSAHIPCSMLCTLYLWSHAMSEMLCLYQALAVRLHSLQSWTINLHSQTVITSDHWTMVFHLKTHSWTKWVFTSFGLYVCPSLTHCWLWHRWLALVPTVACIRYPALWDCLKPSSSRLAWLFCSTLTTLQVLLQ